MFNLRDLRWPVFLIWILLSIGGLVAIYSATQGPVSQFLPESIQNNFFKQIFWILLSLGIVFLFQLVNPRTFQEGAYLFYLLCVVLMILTLFFGREINGAKSWLSLGPINIQVSELLKLATIMAAASFLTSQRTISVVKVRHSFILLAMFLIPVALVLLQNDTGTAIVFLAVLPVMLFWSGLPSGISLLIVMPVLVGYLTLLNPIFGIIAGVICSVLIFYLQRTRWLGFTALLVTVLVVFGIQFAIDSVLQPHQKARIEAFINPELDPQGAGWNVLQAKTAIGSGGLTGKGFLQGTQTQLRFLPEQWTDFIFCVIGEEFGFFGTSLILTLFLLLFLGLLRMAGTHKHPFAQLVMIGVTSVFFTHFLINIGSALGVLPVIGIPLPFISYGGSSFVTNTVMLAICLNLDLNRRSLSIYR